MTTSLLEAEGDILNPDHIVDPSWLEGTDGEDGTTNADTLHDDDDAIGALSRQTCGMWLSCSQLGCRIPPITNK